MSGEPVILAVYERKIENAPVRRLLLDILNRPVGGPAPRVTVNGRVAMGVRGGRSAPVDRAEMRSNDGGRSAVATGRIYNAAELAAEAGGMDRSDFGVHFAALYGAHGAAFPARVDGSFAFAIGDPAADAMVVGRDSFGIEPLFCYRDGARVVVASDVRAIFKYLGASGTVDRDAVARYLLFNYIAGEQSIYERVSKLRPAHVLVVWGNNEQTHRYWKLSFARSTVESTALVADDLLRQLRFPSLGNDSVPTESPLAGVKRERHGNSKCHLGLE